MGARRSPSRPDHPFLCLFAFWFCMKLGAAIQGGTSAVCCIKSHPGAHPNSCGTCSLGKCCAIKTCSECRALPQCREGEELFCSGTLDFRYSCKPCPNGTYKDAKNHCCVPWTDCQKHGLQTRRPGNRTHNVQCGQQPETVATQPGCATAAESIITTILTVLTAAGILALLLLTSVLIVCAWRQNGTFSVGEDPKTLNQLKPTGARPLQEDTYSCQFPEEEEGGRGGKMAEE